LDVAPNIRGAGVGFEAFEAGEGGGGGARVRAASGETSCTVIAFRKEWTLMPLQARAAASVGKTWLEPAR
jgi:hypothetical protein